MNGQLAQPSSPTQQARPNQPWPVTQHSQPASLTKNSSSLIYLSTSLALFKKDEEGFLRKRMASFITRARNSKSPAANEKRIASSL